MMYDMKEKKCKKSYSGEHSFVPEGNKLKCVTCGYKKKSMGSMFKV